MRKAAQRALDPITQVYDGSRSMLYDTYLAALQRKPASLYHRCVLSHRNSAGNDPDRMKGALWTMNTSAFGECGSVMAEALSLIYTHTAKYAVGGEIISLRVFVRGTDPE